MTNTHRLITGVVVALGGFLGQAASVYGSGEPSSATAFDAKVAAEAVEPIAEKLSVTAEAETMVLFEINAKGEMREVSMRETSHQRLTESVIEAIRQANNATMAIDQEVTAQVQL
jgi:hypothetical protein